MTSGRRIGLAVDAVAAYGRGVIRGIMKYCHSNPQWVITVEPLWSFGTLTDVREWEVDGLIVQTFSLEFEDRVLKMGAPATNVSNFCEGADHLPTVLPDDVAIGRMGADYLLSLGFTRLGFCWPGNVPFGSLRLAAFQTRAAEAGVEVFECNASEMDLGKWLAQIPKPIGVMGCNDDWAHRALNLCGRLGIKVPDEMAILGVDNDELFNSLVTPSLSSIAIPAEEIGFQAAQMLEQILSGEPLGDRAQILAPLRIVPRKSTDVLSVADPDVVKAIRFIRAHAGIPLKVDAVVDSVPLSRRSLERRFSKVLGHSISDEIMKAHVERAKLLLTTTDLPISEIAAACGLVSSTRLGIVFRASLGESPTEYRKRAGQTMNPRRG